MRRKLRPQVEAIDRSRALRDELRAALGRLPSDDPAVVDAVWRGEALGTLLWALQLVELPSYDRPLNAEVIAAVHPPAGPLREEDEILLERDSARLWHWRARTTQLQAAGEAVDLPPRYATFDQLIAATAMRGSEQGLRPGPLRGAFPAYGKVYRHLSPEQAAEAHSLAVERHQALNWLAGGGETWADVPLCHRYSESSH